MAKQPESNDERQLMSTKLMSLSEAAGVICPKETGEMKTDADCHGCEHFDACWNALMKELEDTRP